MQKHFNLFLIFALIFIISCKNDTVKNVSLNKQQNKDLFIATMQKHLDAVTNKDAKTLKSTMHPDGKMQLLLPSSEVMNTVDSFMDYHREWFKDTTTTWSFKTKILNTEVGDKYGIAITEILYSEPERDSKPYWHRMSVSYALEKVNNNWYIIKDHASSIEKSTDKKAN